LLNPNYDAPEREDLPGRLLALSQMSPDDQSTEIGDLRTSRVADSTLWALTGRT
jgi:hypothetical protein